MSEVTGRISTLPGTLHSVPAGCMCDDHPDREAVARIQGETDSFGAELIDMCQECLNTYREEIKNSDTSGTCDWCNSFAQKLRPRRDYEEGSYGRVYQVCDSCVQKETKHLLEETEDYWYDD